MRSVELFAGCGGLAFGLARVGFRHELVVERDLESVNTLRQNKKKKILHVRDWIIDQCDTRDMEFSKFKGVDLVSGGPPCQPFSIGGKHLGPKDPRNMWPEAIRAIREIRPKAFIFENVRGLFRPDFASYLEYIRLQLAFPDIRVRKGERWNSHLSRLRQHMESRKGRGASYQVFVHGINAADYGAPQKRHRAVVVGLATELGTEWRLPAPTHSQEALAWSKHVTRKYWDRHEMRAISEPASMSEARALQRALENKKRPRGRPWITVRDSLKGLSTPAKVPNESGHWQHPGARSYQNHIGSNPDEPAKALKAGDHGVPGGENMVVNRLGNVRYFTIREMARLQGLPDDFVISGTWKAATRQLGNAVPIAIGEIVGAEIVRLLKRYRRRNR